jgi:hypothetical protein
MDLKKKESLRRKLETLLRQAASCRVALQEMLNTCSEVRIVVDSLKSRISKDCTCVWIRYIMRGEETMYMVCYCFINMK